MSLLTIFEFIKDQFFFLTEYIDHNKNLKAI